MALTDLINSSDLPFNVVNSPYFRAMLTVVGSFGAAYKLPCR